MKPEALVALTHAFAGSVVGWLYGVYGGYYGYAAIAVLAAVGKITEMASAEKKDLKWWLSNSLPVFFFSFMVFWTLGHNMR